MSLRNWCFTVYDFPHEDGTGFSVPDRDPNFKYCVLQLEQCPTTGALHWQGYIEFKKTIRMAGVKKLCNDQTMHLEPRRGTQQQAIDYCKKLDSAIGDFMEYGTLQTEQGKRTDHIEAMSVIKASNSWESVLMNEEIASTVMKYKSWAREVYDARPQVIPRPEIDLRIWQKEALGMLDEPVQKRRIIWIWSRESNTGKTTFYDYCVSKYRILKGGEIQNTLYAYDQHGVIWYDLSRYQSNDKIPYHALELLSNQTTHLSTKYQSCMKYVSAHLVVTANCPPDETKIPDRCAILYATLE